MQGQPDDAASPGSETKPVAAAGLGLASALLLHLVRCRVIDAAEAAAVVDDAVRRVPDGAAAPRDGVSAQAATLLRSMARSIGEAAARPPDPAR